MEYNRGYSEGVSKGFELLRLDKVQTLLKSISDLHGFGSDTYELAQEALELLDVKGDESEFK